MQGGRSFGGMLASSLASLLLFAAMPTTTNYALNSYGFGSGGTANSTTSNYTVEGITGELSGQIASTATYANNSGFIQTQQSNVPKVTLTNPSNYYDKLFFTIDTQSNPTDTKYALQISTASDFSSNVNYVKSDDTIGPSLTIADYQTYAAWGGGSGANIIGLASNTTYYLRAKATHFQVNTNKITTESGYGPSSNAATVGQQLSFCLYSNANCGAGGHAEAFGGLPAGTVTNSPSNIGVDFATNANAGGNVYIYGANGGLRSTTASFTLPSATADLSSAASGFGAIIASVSQSGGGPLTKVSPYDGASNNVGAVTNSIATILTSGSPLTGGTASIQLKAKPSVTTPEASDYAETLTLIAAATF